VWIDTVDVRQVHIPNRKVLNDVVVNLTRNGRRRTTIEVGVEYGTDLDAAARALLDAVGGCERALTNPPSEAFVAEYGDSSIDFDLRFWHEPTIWEQHAAVDEVIRSVNRVFGERGIVIAFPQRVIWYGDRADTEAAGADGASHSVG
jgi:small-conductance mechanosensitive channel